MPQATYPDPTLYSGSWGDAWFDFDNTQHVRVASLYTSGTTGFPKGCVLDHRYWLQLARAVIFCRGGHHPRNVLIYEPMFYMQGNALMLAALLANATSYCSARSSIREFLDWVEAYQIDYCAYPAPAVVGIENQPKEKGTRCRISTIVLIVFARNGAAPATGIPAMCSIDSSRGERAQTFLAKVFHC